MRLQTLVFLLSLALAPFAFAADTCVTADCHASFKTAKAPHEADKDDCLACHNKVGAQHPVKGQKSFELTAKVPELCYQCHDPYKKKMLHPPVKDGDCLACHKVHGANNPKLLEVGSDWSSLCFGCHDAAMAKAPNLHGPLAVGECGHCHDPHQSNEKKLLKGKMKEICLVCHSEFGQQMREAGTIHAPVQVDSCTSCHQPHASELKSLLKKPLPDLCLGCHSKIATKHNDSKVKHKPLVQSQGCTGCHSSHFSQGKGLIPADEKTMCLGCHGVNNLGTPPLKNIAKELEKKKFLHGPIQKNRCSPCHDPHGSNNYRLLKGSYPAESYLPYRDGSFSLCLSCHEKDMLRYAETTVYTKFRNGARNLHFVHVSNKRKGRSCKICHDIHASDGEKLISPTGTAFGEWRIPLRFETTRTGGSCAPGCHRPFAYDREKAVEYGTTPPETKPAENAPPSIPPIK